MAQELRLTALSVQCWGGQGWGGAGGSMGQLDPQAMHVCLQAGYLPSALFCFLQSLHLVCLQDRASEVELGNMVSNAVCKKKKKKNLQAWARQQD